MPRWHDSFIRVTWLGHVCDVTHLRMCLDFDFFIWLSYMCDTYKEEPPPSWGVRLVHTCDMTRSRVWYDLLRACLILLEAIRSCEWHDSFHDKVCDMTRSHVWHDSVTCVIWLVCMRDTTCPDVWHDSFRACLTLLEAIRSCEWHDSFHDKCVKWLVYMFDMTRSYAWHDSFRVCLTLNQL